MLYYLHEIEKTKGDSDAARDTIVTTVGTITEGAQKLIELIPKIAIPSMRGKADICVVFVMAELSDLAAAFVRERGYKDEYSEVAKAIEALLEATSRYMPPDAQWTSAPRPPPIE